MTYAAPGKKEQAKTVAPADDPRNKRKIQEVIKACPITVSLQAVMIDHRCQSSLSRS